MTAWKNRLVVFSAVLLCGSFLIFLVAGYTALYWAWTRADLGRALPYLPLARNSGMLAIVCAAVVFAILFSSEGFSLAPRVRLALSLLATVTIAFFAEFRNEGKFCFKNLHHFFGPTTWIHHRLNQLVPALGDFLYRVEYSHWNDFLLGPAIVSVLFPLAVFRIYSTLPDQGIQRTKTRPFDLPDAEQALRFARILMCVGLFWFFWQSWAEKAGYLSNPHSSDEIDLPFEFGGAALGFWMARILTKPFEQRSEKFASTFLADFLSSGVIGLLYTLIVGPLIESVASAVAHSLYPVVPQALNVHEYSAFQRHMRPLELLTLAGATWWSLNRSVLPEKIISLDGADEKLETSAKWQVPVAVMEVSSMMTGYLLILAIAFALLEPQGVAWTLATAGIGLGAGAATFLLFKWAGRHGFIKVFGRTDPPAGQ